jgi:hypothetical protein
MTDTHGHDVAATHDCRTPHCTGEARSSVGRYAYCTPCQINRGTANPDGTSKSTSPRMPQSTNGGGLAAGLDELKGLAKRADKADAQAKQLTIKALAANAEADKLRREFARLMREMSETA